MRRLNKASPSSYSLFRALNSIAMLDLVADRGSSNTDFALHNCCMQKHNSLSQGQSSTGGVHKILPQLPTLTKLSDQPLGAEEVGT